MKEDDDGLFDSFEDDDEFFQGDDLSPLRPSAPERIRGVERDFYARLSCARFKYIPAMPGLKSWLFFVGYALGSVLLPETAAAGAAGGGLLFVLGILGAIWYSRRMKAKNQVPYEITKKL